MSSDLDYLGHLARESARFAQVLSGAPSDAAVTSCPGWDAEDLLWHLGEVQWFWGTIVGDRLTDPAAAETRKPERPAGRAALASFYDGASRNLQAVLAGTPADAPVWTWSADQTAGFIRRRQSHEALIHRVDAELTTRSRSPMDARLSADGVDEVLRVMYGGQPAWGTFTPVADATLRIRATDTGDSWLVTLGRFTGVDPKDGTPCEEDDIAVAEKDGGGEVAATVAGSAADLDCWLWHRPAFDALARSGDAEVLARFDATIAPGLR